MRAEDQVTVEEEVGRVGGPDQRQLEPDGALAHARRWGSESCMNEGATRPIAPGRLDLASGKKVWEYEAASPVTSSPVVATADGQVICFG